jgi:hypothetical protein
MIGRRSRRIVLVGAIGALLGAQAAFARAPLPTEIKIADNSFQPQNPAAQDLYYTPVSHWTRAPGAVHPHNVVQDAGLFSSGSPTSGPIDFTAHASAGSFHYICQVHAGMEGTIKSRPALTGTSIPTIKVVWATEGTDTGRAFDVRYRINGGDWTIWKNDTRGLQATFGANDQPIHVQPGTTYGFQARSEKSRAKPNKRSGWSPVVSYTTH